MEQKRPQHGGKVAKRLKGSLNSKKISGGGSVQGEGERLRLSPSTGAHG